MLNEFILYGYIEIPYPYLEIFKSVLAENKNTTKYKDFPDLIFTISECRPSAICSFAYVLSYEENDEKEYYIRFLRFLQKVKFLRASLHLQIDNMEPLFYQFYSDGEDTHTYKNKIILSDNPLSE